MGLHIVNFTITEEIIEAEFVLLPDSQTAISLQDFQRILVCGV